MERVIEPELMEDDLQCQVYNDASHRQYNDGKFLNSYRQYCGLVSGTLIDLGSGPAVHLSIMQKNFPDLKITGYENSEAMISIAKKNTSVEIKKQDFNFLADSADAVLCLYTLHHQTDPIQFWKTVSRISRGYVYVEDFERPESDKMFDTFNAIEDFKHSLRASFTLNEIQEQLGSLQLPYTVIRKPVDKNINKLIIYQKT